MMGLFGGCSSWTLKKSAILFGCVELCLSGFLLLVSFVLTRVEMQNKRVFVWMVLSVLHLGIFVAYMYGILKNKSKSRFLVLPSLIQSFAMFLWFSFHFGLFINAVFMRRLRFNYGADMLPLAALGMISGVYWSNLRIKYSMYKRMNSNLQPQQSHQKSESNPII